MSAETPAAPTTGRQASGLLREIASGGPVRILLAVVLSLIVGSLLIIFTNERVLATTGYFFGRPGDFFAAAAQATGDAYAALFRGSIYNYRAETAEGAIRPLTETLRFAGPLIAAGLGIALSFRVGMFNIGGTGQLLMGAAFAGFASFQLHLPWGLHLVVAMLFGFLGAALWAGIVGFLKARTGAHEVIVTIMMNYIAVSLVTFLMRTPVLNEPEPGNNPVTRRPDETAQLPKLLGDGFDLHLGFILALVAVAVFWWLMERSTTGFRLRMVGLNPDAARTAGINVDRIYILAMVLSGLFVGLAGINQALGRAGSFGPSIDSNIGFDAITVALLGGSNAIGVLFAGLLFGAMKAAGPAMQLENVPPEVLVVVQGLIVLFIAAPPLIRTIFRLPAPPAQKEEPQLGTRKKPRLEGKELDS
ncbi:ABC transporter permease [Homoserinibacter sp. YIM 151385]|uniref:ABC transporter permease n=1 Tax=Homoserinibacter sp. YIM 151385 TaxID=2985506 RepID=UPI0022F0B849|nr:ABC transporter permease [Homoserinibacter sp. YIM 151385]WBU36819.1 ABC transporter permease [Homoserinibacter sp. YIM 151385]